MDILSTIVDTPAMASPVKRVLFVAAEAAPFVKVGGLADVVGSLPKFLARTGLDVRVVLPLYGVVDRARFHLASLPQRVTVPFGGARHTVRVFQTTLPGSSVPAYFLDAPAFFGDRGVYGDHAADAAELQRFQGERFLFFGAAVAAFMPSLNWSPHVVHCHDWHTAVVPLLLRQSARTKARHQSIASVYTIHNLALQGFVRKEQFWRLLSIPEDDVHGAGVAAAHWESLVNIAKLGIAFADTITTVSPTYAKEILTPTFGAGLDPLLRHRRKRLFGILNGIDTEIFDPAHDAALAVSYDERRLEQKEQNRLWLKRRFGLRSPGPVFGMVSRLTEQKGIDLVAAVADRLVAAGASLAILGTGEQTLERRLLMLSHAHPSAIAAHIGFDAMLAQQIYGGSDFFLMPSRFEPCGLGQMIALRYGTIPVVRATGGLRDTVAEGAGGNGFVFSAATADAFWGACERGLAAYQGPRWNALRCRAMEQDFSWSRSAKEYSRLYALTVRHHASKRDS